MIKKIGILTGGSDCPGLNAAIRAVGKTARGEFGMQIVGFQDGFQGLVEDRTISLEGSSLSGILTQGGTILGTSRYIPHIPGPNLQKGSGLDQAKNTYLKHELDALVCIGGWETQESAYNLMQIGMKVITLPKSIENSLAMTDETIGFNTALSIATDAIDRLHSTAHSNHRIILVEIMGHTAGWLTLGAGIAGGADVIVIPEIPYDTQKISEAIFQRNQQGKRYSLIAVAEGALPRETVSFFEHSRKVNEQIRTGADQEKISATLEKIEGKLTGNAFQLADRLSKMTDLQTRVTILGHLVRGGAPSPSDRILATHLGTECVRMIQAEKFGVMIAMNGGSVKPVPLGEMIGKAKLVPLDHPWISSARSVGTCLGD